MAWGPMIGGPPDNCPVCVETAALDFTHHPQAVDNHKGVAFCGHTYHINDFALLKSDNALCTIGQIVAIHWPSSSRSTGNCMVDITVLGRVSEMLAQCPDEGLLKDEVCFLQTNVTAFSDFLALATSFPDTGNSQIICNQAHSALHSLGQVHCFIRRLEGISGKLSSSFLYHLLLLGAILELLEGKADTIPIQAQA